MISTSDTSTVIIGLLSTAIVAILCPDEPLDELPVELAELPEALLDDELEELFAPPLEDELPDITIPTYRFRSVIFPPTGALIVGKVS
jgi:hypothetical protein